MHYCMGGSLMNAVPVVQTTPAPLIACIDDSKTVQRHLALILQTAGYDVLNITQSHQAKAELLAHPPAAILMDILMPDVDGYELCRQLHRTPGLGEIPIVILTAQDNPLQRIRARGVGASDFLVKPVNPEQLLTRLKTLLAKGSNSSRPVATPAQPIPALPFWELAHQRLSLSASHRETLSSTRVKLERVLRSQPHRQELWEKLAMVAYLLNHLPLASTALQHLIQLEGVQSSHYRNLGWIAEEMGNSKLAGEYYQSHLQCSPTDVYVRGRLKLIQTQQPTHSNSSQPVA